MSKKVQKGDTPQPDRAPQKHRKGDPIGRNGNQSGERGGMRRKARKKGDVSQTEKSRRMGERFSGMVARPRQR